MSKIIGCIGCGNMGSAILGGFANRLDAGEWHLCGCSRTPQKMLPLAEKGIEIMPGIAETAAQSDILIFAVKPAQMKDVMAEARKALKPGVAIVSIAAGVSIAAMHSVLGSRYSISRCMPTTTALAGRGVFAFCHDADMTPQTWNEIQELFGLLGCCIELPESRFTDFSALIGAGPAYVFAMMQGLSQAGLTLGFTASQSRKMLVELFAGAAELAAGGEKTFMQLRDEVCSPAGLTIAGINVLDRAGFSGLLVDAVLAAASRGREMES